MGAQHGEANQHGDTSRVNRRRRESVSGQLPERAAADTGGVCGINRVPSQARVSRVLAREPAPGPGPQARSCHRLYNEAVRQALIVLWEAGDRICGKRLKAALPLLIGAMEQHGHLALDAAVKQQLRGISAATIDRLLSARREQASGGRKRRSGVGSAIRRSVPIRTFADGKDPPPGYFEADRVEHCGGTK